MKYKDIDLDNIKTEEEANEIFHKIFFDNYGFYNAEKEAALKQLKKIYHKLTDKKQ